MRFRTTVLLSGKTATGIRVPPEVIEELGAGRKPPVRVTIGGYSFRTTVAPRGDRYLVGINAQNREGTGVSAGDEVDVDIDLDTAPRELAVPDDLAEALAAQPEARRFFDGLTHSQKRWYVEPVEQAKKPETRVRRVERAVAMLREGRRR